MKTDFAAIGFYGAGIIAAFVTLCEVGSKVFGLALVEYCVGVMP